MSGIGPISGRADINQVLAEMKNLRAQVQKPESLRPELSLGQISPSQGIQSSQAIPKFGDLLSSAVNAVNQTQKQSGALSKAYEQGDPTVSLSQVMIQSQKAGVSFQALVQVRNKVIDAYEKIMNMPV